MKYLLPSRLLMAAVLSVSVSTVYTASPASALISSDSYEYQVRKITNIERTLRGRQPVSTQWCVDKYAESHARWMAGHRSLVHQDLGRILRNCNLSTVGENIAKGFTSPITVMAAWMASTGHRANILRYRYRLIGVGAYRDSSGRWWVSQVFGTR